MRNNRLRRFLSLGLICLMLTPVISFATTDVTDTDQTQDVVTDDTATDISNIVGYYEKPEAERAAEALANASFDTREELLEKFSSYKYLCDNTDYEMYYDAQTLGIIIRDKKTGAIIESVMSNETAASRKYSEKISAHMTSAVAIRTLTDLHEAIGNRNTKVQTSEFVGCKDQKVTVSELENGFKAHIDYQEMGVSFDFIVTMDDEGVHVLLPYESIEYSKEDVYLGSVYIYALMGYTERGDRDGYMIIPDGNGAIVNYEDFIEIDNETNSIENVKFGSGYTQFVYGKDLSYSSNTMAVSSDAISGGNDPEYIYAPYWGMVHNDTKMSVLAVVDEGDTSMQIEAVFNGVSGVLENFVGPRFVYRRTFYEPTDVYDTAGVETIPSVDYLEDVKLTYLFKSGDDASYASLAVAYRDKLKNEGILTDKASDDLNVRVDFLGTDKEDFLIFKRTVTATTVDNIREIINALTDNGVENMMVVYNGWQKGGIYNVPVSEYKVESAIGGKGELNKLADELNEREGIEFYLGQETQYINTSNVKTTFDAAKKITTFLYNETRRFEEVYRNFRILFPEKSKSNLISLVNDLSDNGIKNIAVDGMPNNLFSYSKKNKLYSREKTIEYYVEAFETIGEKMTVAMNQPFKPYWSQMDAFLDMPLGNSMYNYESEEIPFLAILLNGSVDCYSEYVNFEADQSEYFLKLAAYGVNPSFMLTYENPSVLQYTNSNWIYTSEYIHYTDQIALYYEKLGAVKELTEGSGITDYSVENNVSITTYGNGIKVFCDYKNYLLAVYKDGKILFNYNPQTKEEFTADEETIMNSYYALKEAEKKVAEYIDNAIAKEYVSAAKYKETKYSNGIVIYNDYSAGKVYVEKDGTVVFGYNTSNGSVISADELSSFAGQSSSAKVGEVNE